MIRDTHIRATYHHFRQSSVAECCPSRGVNLRQSLLRDTRVLINPTVGLYEGNFFHQFTFEDIRKSIAVATVVSFLLTGILLRGSRILHLNPLGLHPVLWLLLRQRAVLPNAA